MNITVFIIAATSLISVLAFSNHKLFAELVFWPYRMWRNKEWHRLVSCSFIHADLGHLFFNMFSLFLFGQYVEHSFNNVFSGSGHTLFIVMYFLAVSVADSYNLFKQKDNPEYRSLGASGGVAAVIFAYILFDPFGKIYLFFIPIGIPAFLFGPLYLLYCAYSAKRGNDNIGHVAHFTGSIFGFIFPIIFAPQLLVRFINLITNYKF